MKGHLRRFAKVITLLQDPFWRRALRLGVAAAVEHQPLRRLLVPATLIDVGANKGQFSAFACRTWPFCKIAAFEPMPGPARVFRHLFEGHANVNLHEFALGASNSRAPIYVSKREDSSSLLPISELMDRVMPEAAFSGYEMVVEVRRLDSFIPSYELVAPVLLKLDVQGYELETLIGAELLLPHIDYVYVECSHLQLYAGQPLLDDIDAFMKRSGFALTTRLNESRLDDGRAFQCDCLFARQHERA
jgi:FkbM family methyltransferase